MAAEELYRRLPGVGEVLERAEVAALVGGCSRERVTAAVRAVLAGWRAEIAAGVLDEGGLAARVGEVGVWVERGLRRRARLRRVVNATGVMLQTNLGRAPLGEMALERVVEVARGYCNVEFDLERGERGRRDELVEGLILEVLGVGEGFGVAVVNNCAAATFLGLNTLAEGGEVLVSRGELVEIGGGFRIPEILAKSGAVLREVGTTNRTRVGDYAAAVGPATRLILRVHRSNFAMVGFVEQPGMEELVALGRRAGVGVFEDQGTGCLVDLGAEVGLVGEGSLPASVRSGVALVAASGDKLLGGPQCGLLVGERGVVERVRGNPLYRALRVDKLGYAALEGTLLAYVAGREGDMPVVGMLRMPAERVRARCERWVERLREVRGVRAEVVAAKSVVGGGTTPGASVASFAVVLAVDGVGEDALAGRLRGMALPVVGRVSDGRVWLNLRTVGEWEDAEALEAVWGELAKLGGGMGFVEV